MVEIGVSLRGARESRGLQLADVERQTRVHERYLRALEEEDFDQLPPGAYRRTFLRGYATFLELDADEVVDEYADRYERAEVTSIVVPTLRRQRRTSRPWPAVLAAVSGLTVALVVWLGPTHEKVRPVSSLATRTRVAGILQRHSISPRRAHAVAAAPPPKRVQVKLTAGLGDCWVSVRLGGPHGRLLYENVLTRGQRLVFRAARLWARLGAPTALALEINGKPRRLPAETGNILIDREGARATT